MFSRLIAGLLGLALTVPAHAATVITFADKATFLSSTGATSATGPIPPLGFVSNTPTTVGSVTFTGPNGGLWFGAVGVSEVDWTALLPGHEIAINGVENLDVSFAAPVFAFGFDFVEPETSTPNINAPFVDSTFNLALFSDATPVGAFTFNFNAPNDIATFIGVWSDMSFNNVQIREIVGDIENEFFGEAYTGGRPFGDISPVPIPAALPLFLTALAGLGLLGWRRRRIA